MKIVTCAQMKEAEAFAMETGITSARLMENAGSASARFIRDHLNPADARVAVLCGRGNNGGDGFVVARRLSESGADVTVLLACGAPRTAEASEMLERLNLSGVTLLDYSRERRRCLGIVAQSSILVDAVFGTGFHGEADGTLSELFGAVNEARADVVALDMPSGCDADTGEAAETCIRADYTVTFAAAKKGQFLSPASGYCGRLSVVNIGIPEEAFRAFPAVELLNTERIQSYLPVRAKDSNKGTYGRVVSACGSLTMPGAAWMAASGAVRCGAGLVTMLMPRSIWPVLAARIPEAMAVPMDETADGSFSFSNLGEILRMSQDASCLLIGCGLSRSAETEQLVCELLPRLACPVVLDADGINAVSGHMNVLRESKADLILTPHPGEMARLSGLTVKEIQSDRIRAATSFANEYGVTLVLKGANTLVASPGDCVCLNPTGNPGMARGGSGDLLAGMIAAFRAQGLSSRQAACCGVFLHGLAGDRCAEKLSEYGMLPSDMLLEVPQIFREMSR